MKYKHKKRLNLINFLSFASSLQKKETESISRQREINAVRDLHELQRLTCRVSFNFLSLVLSRHCDKRDKSRWIKSFHFHRRDRFTINLQLGALRFRCPVFLTSFLTAFYFSSQHATVVFNFAGVWQHRMSRMPRPRRENAKPIISSHLILCFRWSAFSSG